MTTPELDTAREVIAYLDDTRGDEMYSAILEGMMERAEALGIRLVRFGYTPNALDEATGYGQLFSMIRTIRPDGLIFLGWTRAGAMYNRRKLLEQMSDIRLMSLGSEFSDIPSVLYRGDDHIGKMVRHLIERHGYRRIAYLPPERADTRMDAWREAMRAHGLVFPELEIPDDAWGVSGSAERTRRFLEILLDERHLPLDAIVSSGHLETETLVSELNRRGIRIPEDIAITGYVDTEFERYATPGITTIDYPWSDMGRVACEQMAAWIRTGARPEKVMLPGRIVIRESCGCASELVHQAAVGLIPAGGSDLRALSETARREMLASLEELFPYPSLDFGALLDGLVRDLDREEGAPASQNGGFLETLAAQLVQSPPSIRQARLETMVLRFRAAVMPWLVHHPHALRVTGELFRRAQALLLAEIAQSRGHAGLRAKNLLQAMQESTQALMTAHTREGLLQALLESLSKLQIPFCALVTFEAEVPLTGSDPNPLLGTCHLLNGRHRQLETLGEACPEQVMARVFHHAPDRRLLQVLPLELASKREVYAEPQAQRRLLANGTATREDLHWAGYVIFEPGPVDEQIYRAIASHLCSALENTAMATALHRNYARLARQAFSKGSTDVMTHALDHAGNAFNSVQASVQLMSQELARNPIPDLLQAEKLLDAVLQRTPEPGESGERMLHLLKLFGLLSQRVTRQRDTLRTHVARVLEKASWMDDTLSRQQTVVAGDREEVRS